MTINRFTATAALAIGATVLTGGIAAAEPEVDPGPGISVQQADPVEDPAV